MVNGEEHWANASDPQIPAALAPVVRGFVTLHNFRKKPQIKISDQRIAAKFSPGPSPQVTFQNGEYALGPGDYAVIYNMNPILQSPPGVSGPPAGFGTTIAVVGRSNINIQDVFQFRNIFGLPSNNPQVLIDGVDPGDLGGDEEAEAVLDTTWSGALAPGASSPWQK
jgi:subtilase family serine protease